jgi:YbbR domain-containing protein
VPVKIELSSELMKLDPFEIRLSPDTIPLKIEPRIFAEIPLQSMPQGEAADGYEVASVKLIPSTVRVSGPKSLVENLQSLPVEEIALDGTARSFLTQVKITNVSSFIVIDRSEPVDVEVTIAEKISSLRFSVPVVIPPGMPDTFSFTETLPDVVEIAVSAPERILEGLQASALIATPDFSIINETGTYELPINVALPPGFTLVSQNPVSVTITATASDAD